MEQEIIQPISKELLKSELTPDKLLRMTNKSHNEIYVVTAHNAPNVLQEIGRLREIAFRMAGGGTGKPLDLDEFDTCENCYKQLIVWNPEAEEIIGGYRYLYGSDWEIDEETHQPKLATSHMFHFSEKFIKEYMPYTVELGRSFVSLEYQNVRSNTKSIFALDNLWDGLGALTVINPDVKYFFGKMTMYPSYIRTGRDMILYFLKKHFDDKDNLIVPMKPLKIEEDPKKRQIEIINTKNNPPIQKSEMIIVNNIEDKFLNNVMILLKPPMLNGYIFNKNFKTIVIPYNIDTPTTLLANTNSNCSSNYNILNNIQKENLSNKNSFVCNSIGNQIMISTSPLFRTSLSPNGEEENERCLTDNTNGDNGRIMYLNNQKIVSRKLDFSKIQLSHQTSSKGVSKTNLHNINYLNYTKTQTNRNKKTGLNTTNNGTKKRTRANIQKEHIIKMIKQKSKNTFDSTSNKVSNNYSKYISNHIHNLKNELIQNKTNSIERPFKKKKNSLQEDKILSLIKNKSKVQKVQKSTSNPKSSRLSKKQPPYPMYIISDVSQLLTENIKFQKGVVIKVENTSGKGKKNQVVVTSTNDSNYHTGALTDETCSNSSQPEYISTKKNNPTLSKHFSIIKLTKTKNNLCNNTNNSKYNNINEHGV